ncbi:MAG TPA: ParB/RepB/Spo0J family partition protein [Solirubrobacteraceae bacterium]
MADRQKGMGRGLAAILSVVPREDGEEFRQIPLELISPNPNQPRRRFDEEALSALASSIGARGVIQPVLVRPLAGGRYELVAGERRWRAAQLAELELIPAVVRHSDDAGSLELALIENMAREDLNPVEEARACLALVEELGLTREEVGLRIGRSRVAVSNLVRLLDLPDEALDLLERGELTEGHGRALLLATENATRRTLARQAAASGWSVRELERRARGAGAERESATVGAATANGHPDREAVIEQIADALGEALGADVHVRGSARGFTAQLHFPSADEALEFAARVRPTRAS